MRERNFRAWDKKNKRWTTPLVIQCGITIMIEPFDHRKDTGDNLVRVDVVEYTGLKDKDHKEIWEGDLIQNDSGRICKVIWNIWCWDAEVAKCRPMDNAFGFKPIDWSYAIKKIGSIYENPELLN